MKTRLLAVAIALTLVGAGCARGQASITPAIVPQGPGPTVVIHQMAFNPQSITVHVGQTVTWEWNDAPIVHNVVFAGFSSANEATGTWSHTFTTPGLYPYRCTDHLDMVGAVTVLP